MAFLSIVVLNYNRFKYTKQTIENLMEKTKLKHEFIFVDNGSKDGTRKYLTSLKGRTTAVREIYVFNKWNFGVAGGKSSGMIHARGDYVFVCDDDILVPDNYDKLLVDVLNVEGMGMSGVNVEGKSYPIVEIDGVTMQRKKENLNGGFMAWKREIIQKVGYFSPDTVYGGDDTGMHLRIKALGLMNAYIVPNGIHLDEKLDKKYEEFKKKEHMYNSRSMRYIGYNTIKHKKYHNQFVPYRVPNRFRGESGKIMPKINMLKNDK